MKMFRRAFAGEMIKILIIILLAGGLGPAMAAVWQWSKMADNNATADPSINWAEGMSPSSVNDSARAMMAQLANYRDDISGLLTTGGTATALTVTTNSGLCPTGTTPNDGQLLSVTMGTTNGVSPTLTADSCNAFPIQSAAGVAVSSATLIQGSPYNMKFSTANSAWMLKGFYSSPTNIALGGLMPFTLTMAPNSNFVFAAGQCLSTITYSVYWGALGSPGPGSCGANQFAIIDMRGMVPAGLDTMPGFSAANRLTSASTGCGTAMTNVGAICANGAQSATTTLAQLPTGINSNGVNSISVISTVANIIQGTPSSSNAGGGSSGQLNTPGTASSITSTGNNNINVTSNNTSGGAHPTVQPTIGVTYLLRVL